MSTAVGSAANVGDALRRGLILTATEAVAIALVVCRQADAGGNKVIAQRADEISIDSNGELHARPGGEADTPGASVASLLEALLPPDDSTVISPALRSLPVRLRHSTSSADTGLKDLQSILRWHLRDDPEQILIRLGKRLSAPVPAATRPSLALVKPPPTDPAPVVEPLRKSETPLTTIHQVLTPIEPSSTPGPLDLPLQRGEPAVPTSSESPRPFPGRRTRIVSAALLIALAGYAGYKLTALRPAAPVAAGRNVTPPAPTVKVAPPISPVREHSNPSNPQPLSLNVNGGAFSPAFSADGSALFFHSGEAGRLLEASLAPQREHSLRSVLADPAKNFHPRPSPDRRWIAFDSDRGGARAVYLVAPDGTGLRKVSDEGFTTMPSWSPDTQWLAFVRGESWRQSVWNVWVRHLQSGTFKRISSFRTGQTSTASWFPNSRTLCYSHDDQLIVVDLANGRDRIIPSPVRGRPARTPAVSPDGSRVVFQVPDDGIWMLDVAGGQMHRVLDDGTAEEFAWDPDGHRFAYQSHRDGEWRIWIMTP